MASNKSKVKEKSSQRRPAQPKEAETTQTIVVNPGYAYVNQDIPILAPDHHRNQRAPHGNRNLLTLSADEHAVFSNHDSTANQNGCSKVNSRILSNQNHADIGIVSAPANQIPGSPRKSATLPHGTKSPKSGQKLSSNSFSGGFLSRLKRKFRLKSKNYELSLGNDKNIEGISYQQKPTQDGQLAANSAGKLDQTADHENVAQKKKGNYKPLEYMPEGIPGSKIKGSERLSLVDYPGDHSMEDGHVIDDEGGGNFCMSMDDPGYESLEDVRRKILQQQKVAMVTDDRASDQRQGVGLSYMQRKLFNISSGGYADIGDEILDGDYSDPRDLGHRRTQSSGFPARCTDGMSNQNGFLPNSSTSMYATCRDVETVGCAKSEDSDTHSLECTQTEDNIKFLLPISSNLGASRTKSYPGKAEDAEDNSKEFFSSGHNSDSFLAQCGNTDESELYANPKIVLRKKSQKKQSDNWSSTTTSERSSHNEKSSQDITCISSSQSGSPEPQQQRLQRQLSEAAPPIPERKYLDVSPTASEKTSFAKDKLYSKLKMETRKKNTGIAEDQLCLAPITPKILKSKAPKENPSACSSECLTERHRGNKVEERSAGRMRTVNKSCITKETMDSSAHRHENLGPRNSDSAFKRDSAAGKLADICSVQKQEKNFFRTPESRKKLILKSSDLISRHEKVSGRKSDSSLKDDKSTLKTSDSSSRLEKLSTKSSESYARHEKLSPKNSDSSIRQEKMSMKVSENRHEKLSPKNSDTRSDTEDYLGIFTPIVQRDDEICLMCQYTRFLHHAVAETSQVTPTVTPKKPIDFMCSKCFYHKNRCHCYVSEPSHAPFESKPWNKLDGSKANMQTLREGTEEESCNVCQQPQTGVSFCAGDKNISKHCESESTCTSGFSYQDRAIISGDVRLVMIGQGNDQRTSPRNEDESERNSEAEKPRNTDLAFIKDNKIVHTSISATLTPSSKCSHSPQGTQLCLGQVPEHCCEPGQTLSPMDSMFGSSSLIESVESRSALPDIGDLDLDLSHCTSDSGCILDDSLGISRRLEHLVPKETEITEKIIDHRIPNLEQQQTTEHAAMVTNSNNISHSSASTDARLNNTPAVNHLQTSSDSFGGGVTDASGSSPSSIDNGCSRNPTFYEESADQVLESLPHSRSDSFADEYGYGCAADFNPKDRLPTVQERPLSGLKNLNLHMTEEDSDVFPQAKLETSESDSQEERKRKEFEYQDYLQSLKCCHGNNDSETSTQPAEKSAHHRSHGHTKHKKKTKKPRLGTRVRSLNQEIPESKTEKRHFSDAAVGLDSRLPDFYYHDNEPVHMTIDEIGMNSDRNFSYEEPIHMSLDELKLSAAFRSKNKVKVKSKSFDEFSYVDNSVTGATKDDHHGYAEEDEIRNPWEVHPTYSPDANYSNQSNVPFTPSRQHQRHQHHHYHQSQSTCHQAVRPRSMIDTVSTTNHHLNNVYESLDSDQESEHGVYELDPPPPPNEPVQFRRGEVLHSAFRDSRLWTEGMEHDLNFVSGQDDREEMIGSESSPDWPMDEDFMRRLEARPPAVIPRSQSDEGDASQNFMDSMQQLKDCGWYWGPLSWEEAEIKLLNKPDGSFLVRDSSNDRYILSLSFNMAGRVHHTRIEHHKGKFSFWSQPDSHGKSTIKDFIEQCVKNSRNGQFLYFIRPSGPGSPPLPVHLLYPISRHEQMRSLQHMCRFQILQCIRRDHIDQLPIPRRILEYLKDPQYYVEFLEG